MHSAWRTLMCLALLAFVLRAMVPAGFMPDPGALQNGRFGVAFCSADSATSHLALDFGRHGGSGSHHHAGSMGCPFAMLATQALGTSSFHLDVPAFALAALGAAYPVSHFLLPRVRVSGPPLGSRAPPLRSV